MLDQEMTDSSRPTSYKVAFTRNENEVGNDLGKGNECTLKNQSKWGQKCKNLYIRL